MIVTGSVWDWAKDNGYLAVSCSCGTPSVLWDDVTIEKVPEEDGEREGKVLTSTWCTLHGPEYCNAILAGETVRPDEDARSEVAKALTQEQGDPVRIKAALDRRNRRAMMRGLRPR